MNILDVFNITNKKILESIKYESLGLRDIAKKIYKSPATIHNNLKLLKKFGLIKILKEKNRYSIQVNRENFYLRLFMQIINYEKIKNSKSYKKLSEFGIVGIYGSFAKGIDDKDSDIDLFVLSDIKEFKIREIINKLSQEIGREINLLFLNKNKLEELRKKDYEFYIRLKLESIVLNGEVFD